MSLKFDTAVKLRCMVVVLATTRSKSDDEELGVAQVEELRKKVRTSKTMGTCLRTQLQLEDSMEEEDEKEEKAK